VAVNAHLPANRDQRFAQAALHAYLMSDVPLILPVDQGRMWGDLPDDAGPSIIAKNKVPLKRETPEQFTKQPHAVVLVGCHERERTTPCNRPSSSFRSPARKWSCRF